MNENGASEDSLVLENDSKIAVVGGGPAGSFFSIFALKMAKMVDRELNITIFEPKDFTTHGPGGCNRCGGVISELLVQTLALEGINLPDSVVRKGINSYKLHTNYGSVFIATPAFEKTIATVYRGGGPRGMVGGDWESFDKFLLEQAVKEGARVKPLRIDSVQYKNEKPVLYSDGNEITEADLVVGAFGVNSSIAGEFEKLGFGYKKPATVTAAIAEIQIGEEAVRECFGDSIHLFLVPDRDTRFAAMIPKGAYITLCILGKDFGKDSIRDFINRPVVREVLPPSCSYRIECRCLPKMNIGAPRKPFSKRIVMCGDAGSTRLFKDGLGAAYIMGKAVAKTVVFEGVAEQNFYQGYYPVYKSIINDNYYGIILFSAIGVYRKVKFLTQAMLNVVQKEQGNPHKQKILSTILWDMFTGNERYKRVFLNSLKMRLQIDMCEEVFNSILRRSP